jgi:hypothetical protein
MPDYDVENIKKLWKKETDAYVWKAATEDIQEYPTEIQDIILKEAKSRGLLKNNAHETIESLLDAHNQKTPERTNLRQTIDTVRYLLISISIFITEIFLFNFHWLIGLLAIVPVFIIFLNLWGFLTLPLYSIFCKSNNLSRAYDVLEHIETIPNENHNKPRKQEEKTNSGFKKLSKVEESIQAKKGTYDT